MPNIYADESYPYAVVLRLRALGHEVLTAREDGRANQIDGFGQIRAAGAVTGKQGRRQQPRRVKISLSDVLQLRLAARAGNRARA